MEETSSDRGSLKNVNVSQSVRSETRAKFDALLKAALKNASPQKSSYEFNKSTQNLISVDNELADTKVPDIIGTTEAILQTNKVMILDRFLKDTACSKDNKDTGIQMKQYSSPILKRGDRSSRIVGGYSNGGTYEVISPKVLTQTNRHESVHSDSSGTYIIEKNQSVADIVVHHNPAAGVGERTSFSVNVSVADKSSMLSLEQENDHKKPVNNKKTEKKENLNFEHEAKPQPKKRTKVSYSEQHHTAHSNKNLGTASNNLYSTILSVIIHRTDRLQLNSLVNHPLVSVHIMNTVTGKYLKRAQDSQPDDLRNEKDVQYISPVLTDICIMGEKGYVIHN